MKKEYNVRALAATICQKVIKNRVSLNTLLSDLSSNNDINFIQELSFGTIRYFNKLEGLYTHLL